MVLLETKISEVKVETRIKQLGFSNHFRQDAVGFSGGIWLLRDEVGTSIQVLHSQHQLVHVKAKHKASTVEETVTFVYANPHRLETQVLWDDLCSIASTISSDAWMVLGDFNDMHLPNEKYGGGEFCWNSVNAFKQCLESCYINDLGFKGPKFTWKRNNLQERLDRVSVNERWNVTWPDREVVHLPYYSSDHRPILLGNPSIINQDESKSFKFLASWLTDDSFEGIVVSAGTNPPVG
ncbi:uncharacterized protein LOC133297028 [Gastrolobium bilobum]|uniref:uncharacterized protein LOC133297028 n=1 Tax=Gastrolobium bilobum TaxID=150636 RepID=UPI002AB1B76F|nr:uncharacterized protein LOC133297028 [Gastrolobium bilobum]